MEQQSPISWLVKCGLSATVLLIACGIVTAWVGNGLPQPATTTRDGTLITLNRYVQEPIPDVVLVGSSLTYRLSENYFTAPRLRNLALAGGSAITGLKVVTAQVQLPKVILVEANFILRLADDVVVARYARGGDTSPFFLRPIRTTVAAFENWIHAPPTHEQIKESMDRLLKEPPSDFDNRVYLDRAVQAVDAQPTGQLHSNADALAEQVDKARKLGVRILLFEVPYPAEITARPLIAVTSRIMHDRFPDRAQWLTIDVDTGQLRWPDGFHLDERSAMLVARSVDKALPQISSGKIVRTD